MSTGLLTSDRVITVVRNDEDRDRLYPEPNRNQAVFRLDTYAFELWDGSAWVEVVPGDLPVDLIWSGTGSPEGVVTAGIGSTYQQTDGAFGKVLWIKRSGTGNTGWALIATSLGIFNVRDYGVVGDGVTNDTVALQACVDAVAAGGTLEFPDGTYLLDPVTIDKVLHLKLSPGATIKARTMTTDKGTITYAGELSGVSTTLAGAVAPGASSADLTDAGDFSVGDICKIEDTSQAVTEYAYEYVRIFAKDGNTVYFVSPTELPYTYPASASGVFTKVNALEGIRVTGGKFDGDGLGGTSVSLLRFEYCFEVDVEAPYVTNWRYAAVDVVYSKFVRVSRPKFTDATGDLSAASPPDAGYGINMRLGSSHLAVNDGLAWRCRHAVIVAEGGHTVQVNGGDYSGCYLAAVETHFRRARIVEFNGCTISGVGYASSDDLTRPALGHGITGGTTDGSVTSYDTLVLMRGIKVQRVPGAAVRFVHAALANTHLVVDGAIIEECAPATAQSSGSVHLLNLRHALLANIVVRRGDTVDHAGFRIQGCEDVDLVNADVHFTATQSGGGNRCYYIINSKRVTLTNCRGTIDGAGQVFRVDSTSSGDSDQIRFVGCTATTSGGSTARQVAANATNVAEILNSWNADTATPAVLLGGLTAAKRITATQGVALPVNADLGNASGSMAVTTHSPIIPFLTTLTNTRAWTLSTSGAVDGDSFFIYRTGGGAFPVNLGPSSFPLWQNQWVLFRFVSSAWVAQASGRIGLTENWQAKTTTYSVVDGDDGLFLGGSSWTLTLQSAATRTRPLRLRCTASGTVTIARAGSDTIEGSSSSITMVAGEKITLMPNGTDWLLV